MEIHIKANGWMINIVAMVYILGQTDKFMKVIGRMINMMAKEN